MLVEFRTYKTVEVNISMIDINLYFVRKKAFVSPACCKSCSH